MLDALYLKSIEKKDEINEFFDNITQEIDLEKVRKGYVEYDFKKTKQDKNFAAIDGSFNKTKFMAGYVYALTSQTIISKCNQGVQKESQSADMNKISTIENHRIDSILSAQMSIMELKSTLDTLRKHPDIDYMLMDGSIRGTLMNYRPNYNLDSRIIKTFPQYYQMIENELNKEELKLEVTTENKRQWIITDIINVLSETDIDVMEVERDILTYLTDVEELLCIYYLLRDFKDKLICISKTSSTKSVFGQFIPDSAVIEYTCNKSGYTHPMEYHSNKIIRQIGDERRTINYPVKNIQLSENTFTISFTKLEDKSNVLKIEIPRKISTEELTTIYDDLESISVEGYPHILKKAHDEVKISTAFMKRINRNLGLYDKTGRDMLN